MHTADFDVLVIGAGPSGLAAALELKKLGVARVQVVDREPAAGGVPRHCDHTGFGLRDLRRVLSGPAYARKYVAAAQNAGVAIRTRFTVTDWLGNGRVQATAPEGLETIRARAVVLATGCRERPRAARLVPGSRAAGVYTTGSLQRFVMDHGHPIGKRAVVVGAEHVSYSAVHTLRHAGLPIAGMVTEHPRHQSYALYIAAAKGLQSVPLITNSRISNILGRGRVEAVEVTEISTGRTRELACDTVVFTGGWIPDREVARKAGLALDGGTQGPEVDPEMRSSHEGVFAVGNLVHPGETADTAALSGRSAARHVAAYLESGSWPAEPVQRFVYDPDDVEWISPGIPASGSAGADRTGEPGDRRRAPRMGTHILRVSRMHERTLLEVRQDGRLLWQRRYRRMVPNLPYRIPTAALSGLDGQGGDIRITLNAS